MRVHNKTQSQVTIKALNIKPITISANSSFEFEDMSQLKLYKPIIQKIVGLEIDLSAKVETKVELKSEEKIDFIDLMQDEISLPPRRGRRPNTEESQKKE